jgi:hypothetical protein
MSSTGNRFLDDFIQRQIVITSPMNQKPSRPEALPFDEKEEFARIIKNKPSKKVVLKYFQQRSKQLQ